MMYRRTKPWLSLATAAMMLFASSPATAAAANSVRPARGLVVTESNRSFEETWSVLNAALDSNSAISIVGQIDHAAAAASVGLELDPNRVVFFGNPRLGTPLMLDGRTAGIDLPQKIQVFVEDGTVLVAYNSAALLADRHDGAGVPTLETIANALATLTQGAAENTVDDKTPGTERYRSKPGLITETSAFSFDATWNRLIEAIGTSPAAVAFSIDHQMNARSVGLDLPPTRLVVFGNPKAGTRLMQETPAIGIDLPLKMLVWEDADGSVFVTHNSAEYLAKRHFLNKGHDVLAAVDGLLGKLRSAAALP